MQVTYTLTWPYVSYLYHHNMVRQLPIPSNQHMQVTYTLEPTYVSYLYRHDKV